MNTKSHLFLLIFSFIPAFLNASPRFIKPQWRNKIVGGIEADRGEFPWIINILRPNHFCGGTIINEEWVVTAAHCAQALKDTYTLVAGDHSTNTAEESEQSRTLVQIVNHPDYNAALIENDIALMKVSPPFKFDEFVQPATLAPKTFVPTAMSLQIAAGWGRLTEDGSSPTTLMKVNVPFVTDEECRKSYGDRIKDTMMCAGEADRDACQGDSGGPLVCPDGGSNKLCGIVSWGTGCARPDLPGVYTEVSQFLDWIDSVIKG